MPAAPWPVRLELGLRLPRAPKQDLGAWKTEGLTVSRLERNVASGKAPKLVVDGGRELEREKAHG